MGNTLTSERNRFEESAFAHLDDLYRAASFLAASDAAAEEAVLQSFRRARKAFDDGDRAQPTLPWMLRHLIETLRRQRRSLLPASWLTAADDIRTAVRALPGGLAEVLLLADVFDFSYTGIAAILGIPRSLVEVRLREARAQLLQEAPPVSMYESATLCIQP